MSGVGYLALLVGVAATTEDIARRRISNWIPVAALLAGTVCQTLERGPTGLIFALAGAAAGFGVFLTLYLLGAMGGGDVKLMAGFGALLGAGRVLPAALLTAAVGGLLALAFLVHQHYRGKREVAIPYAPAITAGAWLALFAG